MARFLVTRAPGPAWDPTKSTREQRCWERHAAFMDALADEHFVAFGGPVGDGDRVALVVDAPAATDIGARLGLDPWSSEGRLRTVAVEPWSIWLGADERVEAARSRTLHLAAYVPGPSWDHARARTEQAGWDAHAEFMDQLTERHVVVLGGPLDELRALLVIALDDEPTVRRELAADPWYGSVLTIKVVEPWTIWLP